MRLGKKSGDIQKRVRKMYDQGVLSADPEPPGKGSVFKLRDEWRAVLEQAIVAQEPPGICQSGQRVLEVEVAEMTSFYSVIRRGELSTLIAWALELDGGGRLLLVLSRAISREQAERLQATLEAGGHAVRPARFGDVLRGDELRAQATAIKLAVEGGQ